MQRKTIMEQHNHQFVFSIIATAYILISVLIVLYYLPKRHKKNNAIPDHVHHQKGIAQYTCPNCHQQVHQGVASAGRGVIFFIEDLQ